MKLYQSEEKVLEYVEQQIEESKNKLLEELTEKQRDYYRESVELLEDKSFIDVNKIKSLGLEIQLLTTYTPSRSVPCDLKCFIAGDGIFFEVVLDRTSEDLYSDIDMSEKGLVVPYLNFNYDIIKQEYPTVVMRDFRAHSAIENLAWCAYHAELNDSDGLIEVDDGAVHFFIEYEVFLNLYTMFAKPKVHFIDGIIETDSEII